MSEGLGTEPWTDLEGKEKQRAHILRGPHGTLAQNVTAERCRARPTGPVTSR